MAEENTEVTGGENTGVVNTEIPGEKTTGSQDGVQQGSKYDELARAQGWVPKEEWQGDPDDWTDSKEFVRRGELFGKISSQSSEIKELRRAMTALTEHHNKVKETEFRRALDYLKQQKKAALEEGDADKLLQVEDAIDTLKTEQQGQADTAKQPTQAQLSPVFVQWVQQNQWYAKDTEMRTFADSVGVNYYQRNPDAAEADVYQYVLERAKKAFPEKFSRQGPRVPTVESGNTVTRGNSKSDSFKLSEEEERVMKTFVRQGIMSKEQYIADLRKVRGE